MAKDHSSPSDRAGRRRSATRSLALRPQPGRPLNKKQQAFNRLVAAIERLRNQLDADTRRFDAALVFHAQHVQPRVERVMAMRKDLVRALLPFLDDRRLKRNDQQELRAMLAGQLDDVLGADGGLEDDLRALFEELHGATMAELEREEMDAARAAMEGIFAAAGVQVDLSAFRPGMSEEEIAAKAAGLLDDVNRQAEQAQFGRPPGRRPTKREIRENARVLEQEKFRKSNIGSIYRRLAKVLHPDLEQDPGHRERKSALMQELTAAYAGNDLHTLLRLEMEWIHRQESDEAQMTDEKVDAYVQLLREQVADLEAEVAALPLSPRYHPLVEDAGPFGVLLRLDGVAETRRLDGLVAGLSWTLTRLTTDDALTEVREAIRTHRQAARVRY